MSPPGNRCQYIYCAINNHFPFDADRPESWRLLGECMQGCLQAHEEWLEIMKDYSTVFCTKDDLLLMENTQHSSSLSASSTAVTVGGGGRRGSSVGSAASSSQSRLKGSEEVYQGTASSLHYRVKSSRSEVTNILTDTFSTHFSQTYTPLPNNLGKGSCFIICICY